MGKGQRSRAARAEEMARKKLEAKKKAKRDKVTKVVASVCCSVLAVAIVGALIFNGVRSAGISSGKYLKKDVAFTSANYTVTNAMMLYYFQNYYSAFVSQNSDYLSYYGLDTSKSLKDQSYPSTLPDGSSGSWFDYFLAETTEQVEQSLVLAEGAKANGVELDDEENEQIEQTLENISDPENFGPGLTVDEIRECLQIATLASKYSEQVEDSIECTDKDIEEHYNENRNHYNMVDFRIFTFNYAAEDEEAEDSLTRDQAQAYANELAATKTEEEYVAWLSDYFTKVRGTAADELQDELDTTRNESFAYSESYEGIDFLFGEDSVAGQTHIFENDSDDYFKVYMLLKPSYRDESTLKNVRHILISVADTTDEEAMAEGKAKAEELLAEWRQDPTEDHFAELAHDNTDDTGSAEAGGLYENVGKGQMVEAFENWTFDESRKTGDTGIVETEYGYHIMYFVGDGEISWKSAVRNDIVTTEYSNRYAELETKYSPVQNDDKIKNLKDYIA